MADFGKLMVLVVDDNRAMRTLLREILNSGGIRQIIEADDGAAGLSLVRGNACDLVLTDLEMAPMDGLEFARAVRRDLLNPHVPIIMISGHNEKKQVEAARDSGVTAFLVKPVTPQNLFARIEEAIDRPRAFVRTNGYLGPDRRRKAGLDYDGPARRATDQEQQKS